MAHGQVANEDARAGDPLSSRSQSVLVSETFVSIQGEGKLVGVPSWFLRLSGCNLRCVWCDTPYASWHPEGATRQIADLIDEAKRSGVNHAVVTGGEPMMFPQITAITLALRDAGLHVTIETAGTLAPDAHADLMSISPKLATSTPSVERARSLNIAEVWAGPTGRHEQRRLNLAALQTLIDRHAERQLKFVVSAPADLIEIELLLTQLHGWQPGDIMLMPEGVKPAAADVKHWLTSECIKRNWRYCSRLHIELFGNVRGT